MLGWIQAAMQQNTIYIFRCTPSEKKEKKDEKLDMLPVSEYIDKGSKVLFPIICFTDRF